MSAPEFVLQVDDDGRPKGPYRVEVEADGMECGTCEQRCPKFEVIGPTDEEGDSMGFGLREDAQDRADAFNTGWQRGQHAARALLTRIAYEPFGPSDADPNAILDAITKAAREFLA